MMVVRTFLLVSITCSVVSIAHAQDAIGFNREINLTVAPAHPEPGQTVHLSIQTRAIDLNRSNIAWFVNGNEAPSAADATEMTITAGKLGSETDIVVVAEDDQGLQASAEATIRPTEVDLLWEATSYVPPFYAGRALPGTQSKIRAQALARFVSPKGETIANSNIVYTWYRNGVVVAEGRGKSTALIEGPSLFGSDTVRVLAVSLDQTLSGEATVIIPSIDPFIVLHENHPLFGILYHRSLEPGATTMETEQKVTAVPYFADISSPSASELGYDWSVNESRVEPNPDEPQTLTINAGGYSGPADIKLTLMSAADVYLRALGSWQLIFGEESRFFSGLNPFGGE